MKKIIILLFLSLITFICSAEDSLLFDKKNGLTGNTVASPLRDTKKSALTDLIEEKKPTAILPIDEAFQFSTYLEEDDLLILHWQIAEGYYLYQDKFKFSLESAGKLGEIRFPPAILKEDKEFGEVPVYLWEAAIAIPFTVTEAVRILSLEVSYQGCADGSLCYPPTTKTVIVELADHLVPSDEAGEPTSVELSGVEHEEEDFLKADEAFMFSAEFPNPTQIVVRWLIADGYYLYRDKFKFSLMDQGTLGEPQFPPSVIKQDPTFGETQVYTQALLEFALPVSQIGSAQTLTLKAEYQGCAEAGLCYPPLVKTVELSLGKTGVTNTFSSEQDRIAQALLNKSTLYTIALFFGFGLLLAFTPCVFPMIPILSSLVIGQEKAISTYRAFIISLVYVLAVAITYTIAGVIAGLAGQNLQITLQQPWLIASFAMVFVLLALSMFGFYELQIPARWQTKLAYLSNRQQGGSLIGAAVMGFLSALMVGPCVAAPLAGALIYISQTKDALLGGLALFSMSLGMGIPLLIIGTSAGQLLPKAGMWMNHIKVIFGIILLAVALWMIRSIVPEQVILLLWAGLFILSAVYMGALEPVGESASGGRKFWKGIGVILLVYGIILLVGAASGRVDVFHPLQTNQQVQTQPLTTFKPVKNLAEFEQVLATAKVQNKIVMLDFYADWCTACAELEEFTFSDPNVQTLLSRVIAVQADVTENNANDRAFYKRFQLELFGPPMILFFTPDGQELAAYRIIGFIAAESFYEQLTNVLSDV